MISIFTSLKYSVEGQLFLGFLEEKMKDFPGTPGTFTGLVLRVSQCLFAAASIASMATSHNFFKITAFWYYIFIPVLS